MGFHTLSRADKTRKTMQANNNKTNMTSVSEASSFQGSSIATPRSHVVSAAYERPNTNITCSGKKLRTKWSPMSCFIALSRVVAETSRHGDTTGMRNGRLSTGDPTIVPTRNEDQHFMSPVCPCPSRQHKRQIIHKPCYSHTAHIALPTSPHTKV